ncbi:hypothetical protein [Runella sp.]|uniref:hypothetical protein n=1 Tax=Runella sp. TaxID=1960881 RepID=UPI003D0E29E2
MTFEQITRTLISAEILVFLCWLYKIWFPDSGADPAGKGLGVVYTLALGIYILVNIGFMFIHTGWSMSIAAVLALMPVLITIYGVILWLKTRNRHY